MAEGHKSKAIIDHILSSVVILEKNISNRNRKLGNFLTVLELCSCIDWRNWDIFHVKELCEPCA